MTPDEDYVYDEASGEWIAPGEAVAAVEREGRLFVTPQVTGSAHLTGFHDFIVDPDDPLPRGFRVGNQASGRPS